MDNELNDGAVEVNGLVILPMSDIPAKENPFIHDSFRMGTQMGSNITIMYENFPGDEMQNLVIVNTVTGKRTMVIIPE